MILIMTVKENKLKLKCKNVLNEIPQQNVLMRNEKKVVEGFQDFLIEKFNKKNSAVLSFSVYFHQTTNFH